MERGKGGIPLVGAYVVSKGGIHLVGANVVSSGGSMCFSEVYLGLVLVYTYISSKP